MYRLREIIEKFSSLVGWKDTDTLSQSESGLYFQEAHPLLTLRAMRGIMPKDLLSRYPLYEMGTEYAKGVKVQSNGKCYGRTTTPPSPQHHSWREYDLLEDYLTGPPASRRYPFIGEKIKGMERNPLDRRTLFGGQAGRKAGILTWRLVGFEFNHQRNGITTTQQSWYAVLTIGSETLPFPFFRASQLIPGSRIYLREG